MKTCPVHACGRKFENDETMLEHVKRRHPNDYEFIRTDLTKSVIEAEHARQQELNKLPKLQKIMSREKKAAEIHRRSMSKNKKDCSSIIQDSRQIVNPSGISARRPSLKSKQSDKVEKLPSININRSSKKSASNLALDISESTLPKTKIGETTSQNFYTTAPHFNPKMAIKVRSREKIKTKTSEEEHRTI